MKRKYYQIEKKSRTAYRRYRLHKVKKNWVVKSSVIGAMILGGSSSAAAVEAIDPASIEQAVEPSEETPPLEPEVIEQAVDVPVAAEEKAAEESTEPVAEETKEVTENVEPVEVKTEEDSKDAVGVQKTPLEEKIDVEIVQPALSLARTVQNEPEIASLITNLLQAQEDDTVNYYGGVTTAANELKAAVPEAKRIRGEAVDTANAAILYDGYFEIMEGWSYHNLLDSPHAALVDARTGATSLNPTVTSAELVALADEYMVLIRQVENEIINLGKAGPLSDQGNNIVQTKVTYRYIDRSGNKVIEDIVKDAVSGNDITPEKITIEGYTYDGEDRANSDPDMIVNEDGTSMVVYFYRANKAEITYRYVDENGDSIISDHNEASTVDAAIPERIIDIENYTYSAKGEDSDSDMIVDRSGKSVVTYIYTANKATVTHRYVNEKGETLEEDQTEQAAVGSPINGKITEIEGYTFKQIDANSDDDMKVDADGSSVVIYVYAANDAKVIYHYVYENYAHEFYHEEYVTVDTKVDAVIEEKIDVIEGNYYVGKSEDSDADMIVDRDGISEVTYVYQLMGAYSGVRPDSDDSDWDHIPLFYWNDPDDPSKAMAPDDPRNNQVIPYYPGYQATDEFGNPLELVDPDDPEKGYKPPGFLDHTTDTVIKYVEDDDTDSDSDADSDSDSD
ncbi:MucBP domain-containing protein, partial [Enterococcus hulanensis]|uniref:MucBP domain-containing protein n=1 Tax=Enterococcus hulanensis TaxID=2559929 RepID=UPI001A8F7973